MARLTRGVKVAVAVPLALVVLVLGVRFAIFKSYEAKVSAEIALLESEGGSLRLADLAPRPLGKGSTETYALLTADQFTPPPPRRTGRSTRTYSTFAGQPYTYSYSATHTVFTTQRSFLQWLPRSRNMQGRAGPAAGWDEKWLPNLGALVSDSAGFLDFVRTTVSGPPAVFDTDWTAGYGVLLPHLVAVRNTAQLLAVSAVLNAHKGDMDAAMVDVGASLRLRRLIDNDPILASKLVAYEIDVISYDALEAVMREGRPSRAAVEMLLAELADRERRNSLSQALLGDTAGGISVFDEARKDPDFILRVGNTGDIQQKQYDVRAGVNRFLWTIGTRAIWVWPADEYNYLREMRAIRARAKMSFHAALASRPWPTPSADAPIVCSLVTRLMLQRILFPALTQGVAADANARLARTALALYLYRADNGSYPSSLDALAPKYLPAVQIDPFDGKPLRYKPADNGFVIYSVGESTRSNGIGFSGTIEWGHDDSPGKD